MHLEIFEALRPLFWRGADKEKRAAWRCRVWQLLPVPFQEWFLKHHASAHQYFAQSPSTDTDALYSARRGVVVKTLDLQPGEQPRGCCETVSGPPQWDLRGKLVNAYTE